MKVLIVPFVLFLFASCTSRSDLPAPVTSESSVQEEVQTPTQPTPTESEPVARVLPKITGKLNGNDWEGESIMNPPPYYKYGSRMMMSPDKPIFMMSFGRTSDNSSVNLSLLGELKKGVYSKENLQINYSDNAGTNVYEPAITASTVTVEVTDYQESGNSAIISGKITGSIVSETKGMTTLDLEWKDVKIDVWGMEAK